MMNTTPATKSKHKAIFINQIYRGGLVSNRLVGFHQFQTLGEGVDLSAKSWGGRVVAKSPQHSFRLADASSTDKVCHPVPRQVSGHTVASFAAPCQLCPENQPR
jgi:hypothetical protein